MANFCLGVMPPRVMFGCSGWKVQNQRVAKFWASLIDKNR